MFSKAFWISALQRAARTGLIFLLPFLPMALETGDWSAAILTASLGVVTSILKSIVAVPPEAVGKDVPFFLALLYRSAWSAAQGLLSGVGAATLITEVAWSDALLVAATGALGSLVLGLISSLPESDDPIVAARVDGLE